MITKEDITLLNTYFKSLTTVPEELTKLANKVDLMETIQNANDDLMDLMKESE